MKREEEKKECSMFVAAQNRAHLDPRKKYKNNFIAKMQIT